MTHLRDEIKLSVVGSNIRRIREIKDISQDELSLRTNVSRNQIGRIERGELNTGISTLYEIAEGLGVDIIVLFESI